MAILELVLALSLLQASGGGQAEEILDRAGTTRGLCVHLGCGREGSAGLTADLAVHSRMLVHGIAVDDASLDRARQAIVGRGVAGQASAEKLPVRPLPYVRDLANLVVIEDFNELAGRGLTREEIQRITAPGGTICAREGGRWVATKKERPGEMDDWTHPSHGADGNRVSADRMASLPIGLRWLDGMPGNLDLYGSSRGYVFAGGRCFTLGPTVPANLAPAGYLRPNLEEHVVARDAFNGLPLWDVNCETRLGVRMVSSCNFGPLATDGKRVYVPRKDRLVALEAESGRVAVEYPVKHPTERLLVLGGVLVSSEWEGKEDAKEAGHNVVYALHSVARTGTGAVEAFDAREGKLKWSVPAPAQEILAADGAVFALFQSGNPPARQEIRALDLQTGAERWRVGPDRLRQDPGTHLNCAARGVLVVAHIKSKVVSVYAADDGRMLWEINPAGPPNSPGMLWTPMVDGLLWRSGRKYDPMTGEVKGKLPSDAYEARPCSPFLIVNNLVYNARDSNFWDLSRNGTYVSHRFVRGACVEGATVANGMFYAGQNCCSCVRGQVPGFVAYGPCGEAPGKADFEKVRAVEKGPAFGAAGDPGPAAEEDWPMYRHDIHRSGATRAALPPRLEVLWETDVAPPGDSPLSAAWRARLTPWLTAPVIAEGKVFAAAVDLGQVVALDAATGRPAWRTAAGSRVDLPPAVHRGLCVFGAHDGWVSALSARDGRLAWRAPVAPLERRMVAFGQVESAWPALGAVLIRDGTVFATAGRSSEVDGGIAVGAFDAASGAPRWASVIGTGTHSVNDLLTSVEDRILWRHVSIDPATGRLDGAGKPGPGGKFHSIEGLHDGTWTRLGKGRSGNRVFGRVVAELLVWNDETLFGYEGLVNWNNRNRWCFAIPKPKTAGAGQLKPEEYAWRLVMPPDRQVEALALCGNGLVAAGRVCDAKSDRPRGFLWTVSLEDGRKGIELPLDSPPVYDGVAAAHGRVYVSLENGKVVCLGKAD